MSIFSKILKDNESLFTDEIALDFDFIPQPIKYRENEQAYIATCIKPLFQKRSGKNIIITGKPGIGKTAAIKFIFQELEKETDNIIPIYINCYKIQTPHKITLKICEKLNYRFIHNKTTEELIKEITKILNKKAAVFCLDEIDKIEDTSILYNLVEDINKKTIILITNFKEFIQKLDQRISSRLTLENLEFKPYNEEETKGILKQRIEYAFVQGIFNQEALELIAEKTYELKDIRTGLALLKEAGNIAESQAKREIVKEHAESAINKLPEHNKKIQKTEEEILNFIKQNSGKTTKQIYELYSKTNQISYRTFLRNIDNIEKNNLITRKDVFKGGRTSIIEFNS